MKLVFVFVCCLVVAVQCTHLIRWTEQDDRPMVFETDEEVEWQYNEDIRDSDRLYVMFFLRNLIDNYAALGYRSHVISLVEHSRRSFDDTGFTLKIISQHKDTQSVLVYHKVLYRPASLL